MPIPLAPDPIRVQSCVCCLFWTNRNCMTVTSIFLSISLSNERWILKSAVNGNIYFYCMPSPLAPDPISVQQCVSCLFWTNRNSMAETSIFLSISLSNQGSAMCLLSILNRKRNSMAETSIFLSISLSNHSYESFN